MRSPVTGMREVVVLASLLCGFLLTACADENNQNVNKAMATPVVLEELVFRLERVRIDAVGTSRALRSVTLHPETSGRVTSVRFETGDFVKAGQLLLTLDDRAEQLAVKLARVRLTDAERLYQRYLNSENNKSIPQTTIDAAHTAMQAAQVELENALVALDDCQVKAPFAGFIGITDIDSGDRIDPALPIATLDDRNALLVTFEVPELLIARLAVGDAVTLTIWNDPHRPVQGRIDDIDSRIDPVKRTFIVRARVENAADRLRPGMSFRVKLELDGRRHPAVPEISLQWGGEGAYIWIEEAGKARRVLVTIVQRHQGEVLIDAALQAGTRVVVEGVQRMREGMEIVAWENPAIQPVLMKNQTLSP